MVRYDERKALAQREANAAAAAACEPLPFPSVWDTLDPTKVAPEAAPAEVLASQQEFRRRCRPRPRKRHTL
jgi:hypothetical protein